MASLIFEHLKKVYPNGFVSVDDVRSRSRTVNLLYSTDQADAENLQFYV